MAADEKHNFFVGVLEKKGLDETEEVSYLFKEHGHMNGMLEKLALSIHALMEQIEPKPSVQSLYPFDMALYSVLDTCMMNAGILVGGWLAMSDKHAEKIRTGPRCVSGAVPELDRLGKIGYNDQRDKAFKTVPPVVDELSRGMYLMIVDGLGDVRMPLWWILAASFHLDVVTLLGDEIDRPCRDMVAFDHLMYQTIKDHTEYHKTPTQLKIAGWNKDCEKAADRLQRLATFLAGGRQHHQCQARRRRRQRQANNLSQASPFVLRPLGLRHAKPATLPWYTARAVVWQRFKWDDMELFFDRFFIGKAPSNIKEYHKQLCLVMGFSAGNFIPNTRNTGKMQATKKGPRSLVEQGRVNRVFRGRFRPDSSRINLNAEDVHPILYRDQKPTGKNGVPGSPVHLIDFLAHAREAEIPPQEPDYFFGHRICWTLLRKLKTAIEGDMLKWLGPSTDLFHKAAQVYLDILKGEDGEVERAQVKNGIDVFYAMAKMRKVIPDDPHPASQSHYNGVGASRGILNSADMDDKWDGDYDEDYDSDYSDGTAGFTERLRNTTRGGGGPRLHGQELMDAYSAMRQVAARGARQGQGIDGLGEEDMEEPEEPEEVEKGPQAWKG
ncbi:hypothetical protein QC764_610090 [Podospora pseudoanserina]|uniref:Uncharacterized protein n=1 Tax=Podospora pseudoanserina TaxID=2609844 RepID=A0ABR0HV50_9PEZI|nr:hypothetical protein QC764_610090 [Podospora pseudoanserina]